MASIITLGQSKKTGKPIYQAIIRRKGFKPITKCFTRKTLADKWARDIEADIERGEYRPIKKSEKMTFAELVALFNSEPASSGTGLQSMSIGQQRTMPSMTGFWCAQFGPERLNAITPDTIYDALDALKTQTNRAGQPLSQATIRKYLSGLGSVYRFAIARRLVTASPLITVTKPAADDERVRFLSKEELARLLAAVDDSRTLELPIAVRMAIYTGLRKSELFGLTWERINLSSKPRMYQKDGLPFNIPPHSILVEFSKSGHPRTVPIAAPALEPLREWGKVRPLDASALLFPSRETPSKPLDIRKPWETALRRAGIENFRWHDLRHTFASWLMMTGTSHIEIARLTGHRDLKSLVRYSHLDPKHAADIVGKLADSLGET